MVRPYSFRKEVVKDVLLRTVINDWLYLVYDRPIGFGTAITLWLYMQPILRHLKELRQQSYLLVVGRRKALYPVHLVIELDPLYQIVCKICPFLTDDDTAVADITAVVALQISVQFEGGDIRILPQLVLDKEVCFL